MAKRWLGPVLVVLGVVLVATGVVNFAPHSVEPEGVTLRDN